MVEGSGGVVVEGEVVVWCRRGRWWCGGGGELVVEVKDLVPWC